MPFLQMPSEQQPDSVFRVKFARESNLLVIACKFMYLLLLFLLCFLILFFCFFLYLFVFLAVICLFFCFFRDNSLKTDVIEAVGVSGLSMILVNLWKTKTIRDLDNRDESHLLRHFSLEQSWCFSLSLSLSGFHLAQYCSFNFY